MSRLPMALGTALLLLTATVALPGPVAASHGDGSYDIPAWFTRGETELDIWVVPPGFGQVFNNNGVLNGLDPFEATPLNSHLQAVRDVVDDWRTAIDLFGAPWFRGQLTLNLYVIGLDLVPADVDPEIIVVLDPIWKLAILGMSVYSSFPCISEASTLFAFVSYTYQDVYNVAGHEIGHCLGLSHTNGNHPTHDIMMAFYTHTIGEPETHLHCISNLDVRGLERVYGNAFGQPSGGTASVPVNQYQTMPCGPVPPGGPPI